ncbi:MAG: hypothetical protein IJN74_04900 [Clostridia bacterium]|nr:hypothetical protein [Clostridia bacterium]
MLREKPVDPFLYRQPEKTFIEELKTPVHSLVPFSFGKRPKEEGEVNVSGMYLVPEFADDLLDTAYMDFSVFLKVYKMDGERYPVYCRRGETSVFEEYKIITEEDKTLLIAADTEGIRRGLVFLEDEMRRAEGPYLKKGETTRTPHIRARISHCFFAPINRPPNNGEELADDIDYYPDEYLNRLAHDGINGVWIYTKFCDLVPSKIIPEYGQDGQRRLDKLNRVIAKCKKYGIRVYAFGIEPMGIRGEMAEKYTDIAGATSFDGPSFCTDSERGKAYCKEAFETLFSSCPDLAGALICTNGERTTNCTSAYIYDDMKKALSACPRCKDKRLAEILAQAADAMREGMRATGTDAEYFSWTYGHRGWDYDEIEEYIRLLPDDVGIVQGLEDNGRDMQLGKERMAIDYWLSYVGPSEMFKRTALAAKEHGKTLFAKTQVCCSHEVATVPYVPVPGVLFDKYKAMHEYGVEGVIQCWYFGNYPSIMNKAAGEMAFLHDFSDKRAFFKHLAGIYWGNSRVEKAVNAWECFSEAYRYYPTNIMLSYYGPMHDGPVWLLQLIPKNWQLPQSWQYGDPMDGDRIYECLLCGHSLEEAVELATKLSDTWKKGLSFLEGFRPDTPDENEQRLVASALNCQFESGKNILKFYLLREKLGLMEGDADSILDEMEAIVRKEIEISRRLALISEKDGRLGFHSEAEGFRYFPEKLESRAQYLENLLETEFKVVRQRVAERKTPLEYYEGIEPGAPRYTLGSGWSDFDGGESQVQISEDGDDLVIEYRSKNKLGITVSPEFHLMHFEVPVYIKENGTPFIPWRVWHYFSLKPEDHAAELAKYKVSVLPSSEEWCGNHFEIRLDMKKFGYTGGPMKLALHTNMDEFNPCAYWRTASEECSYLGKYDIHPETYVWIDKK